MSDEIYAFDKATSDAITRELEEELLMTKTLILQVKLGVDDLSRSSSPDYSDDGIRLMGGYNEMISAMVRHEVRRIATLYVSTSRRGYLPVYGNALRLPPPPLPSLHKNTDENDSSFRNFSMATAPVISSRKIRLTAAGTTSSVAAGTPTILPFPDHVQSFWGKTLWDAERIPMLTHFKLDLSVSGVDRFLRTALNLRRQQQLLLQQEHRRRKNGAEGEPSRFTRILESIRKSIRSGIASNRDVLMPKLDETDAPTTSSVFGNLQQLTVNLPTRSSRDTHVLLGFLLNTSKESLEKLHIRNLENDHVTLLHVILQTSAECSRLREIVFHKCWTKVLHDDMVIGGDIGNTMSSDAVTQFLEERSLRLVKVGLTFCQLTLQEPVRRLIRHIVRRPPSETTVKELDLRGNYLGQNHHDSQFWDSVLQHNTNDNGEGCCVEKLVLRNSLASVGVLGVARGMETNRHIVELDLMTPHLVKMESAQALGRLLRAKHHDHALQILSVGKFHRDDRLAAFCRGLCQRDKSRPLRTLRLWADIYSPQGAQAMREMLLCERVTESVKFILETHEDVRDGSFDDKNPVTDALVEGIQGTTLQRRLTLVSYGLTRNEGFISGLARKALKANTCITEICIDDSNESRQYLPSDNDDEDQRTWKARSLVLQRHQDAIRFYPTRNRLKRLLANKTTDASSTLWCHVMGSSACQENLSTMFFLVQSIPDIFLCASYE